VVGQWKVIVGVHCDRAHRTEQDMKLLLSGSYRYLACADQLNHVGPEKGSAKSPIGARTRKIDKGEGCRLVMSTAAQ
jgi:hypothetical protein